MSEYYNVVLRIPLSDPDKAKSVLDFLLEALNETGVPKEKYLAEFKETVGDNYREAKSLIRNLLKRDYGLWFSKFRPMTEMAIGLLGCVLTAILHTEPESVKEWCFSIYGKDAMPGSVVGLLYVTRHGSSFYEPKMVSELIRTDSPVAPVCKKLDETEEDNEDLSSSIVDAVNALVNKQFAGTTDDVNVIVSFMNEEASDLISATTLKSLLVLNKRTNGALAKLLREPSDSDKRLDREINKAPTALFSTTNSLADKNLNEAIVEKARFIARQANASLNECLKGSLGHDLWDKHFSQVLAGEKIWLDKTIKESEDKAEKQTNTSLGKQTEEAVREILDEIRKLETPLGKFSLFEELIEKYSF